MDFCFALAKGPNCAVNSVKFPLILSHSVMSWLIIASPVHCWGAFDDYADYSSRLNLVERRLAIIDAESKMHRNHALLRRVARSQQIGVMKGSIPAC